MSIDLAVLIFLITFVVEALSWIGKEALSDFFYACTRIAIAGPSTKAHRAMKTEILALRAELAATSSQDDFAKWAKLRRKLDGRVASLSALGAQEGAGKAAFATWFKRVLWVATTVLPFVVSSWHRKEAVFYLPPGWLGPAAWWLGLPSAPAGAVACGIWTMACKRAINVAKNIVTDLFSQDVAVAPVPVSVVPVEGKKEL